MDHWEAARLHIRLVRESWCASCAYACGARLASSLGTLTAPLRQVAAALRNRWTVRDDLRTAVLGGCAGLAMLWLGAVLVARARHRAVLADFNATPSPVYIPERDVRR